MRILMTVALASSVLFPCAVSVVGQSVKTGEAAFETWSDEKPGNRVNLTGADIPSPHPEESVAKFPSIVPRNGAMPIAKPGYKVSIYAEGGFMQPRLIRTAPNGDLFLVDVGAKQVVVLRGVSADGQVVQREVFGNVGNLAFGLSFGRQRIRSMSMSRTSIPSYVFLTHRAR